VLVPPNVSSAVPDFVKGPVPLKTPLNVTALSKVNVVAEDIVPAPLKVRSPFFEASPIANVPPML
jgi:hypothetical protein